MVPRSDGTVRYRTRQKWVRGGARRAMRPARVAEPREILAYGRWRVDISGSTAKGDAHVASTCILREHRVQRDRVGDRRGTLHLAGTPHSSTVGGPATAVHPAHLPLHRVGIPGPGRRIAGS